MRSGAVKEQLISLSVTTYWGLSACLNVFKHLSLMQMWIAVRPYARSVPVDRDL